VRDARQFEAIHRTGHTHVGEEDGNFSSAVIQKLQRLDGVVGFERDEAASLRNSTAIERRSGSSSTNQDRGGT
jgi:hypothetical protein